MENNTQPNNNNSSGNNNPPHNDSDHDWKDDVRETVSSVARDAVEDAKEIAQEAKEEIQELVDSAKEKYDKIPTGTKLELNHWTSLLIAVIIGLIIGLAIGWARGNQKGILLQNKHMSSAEMMDNMVANMDGLSGRDLEEQFIEDMIAHHEGAVKMATILVSGEGVSNSQLRSLAANIIQTQTNEINLLKSMNR